MRRAAKTFLFAAALAVSAKRAGLSPAAPPAQDVSALAQQHGNRGVALMEQFRFGEALAEFQHVVSLLPERASGHINLGIAYFNQRDFDRALESLKKAEVLAPDHLYVHYNLGLIYKLQGRTEEALESFQKVAALDPEDAMTQYYLGTLLANLGRLDEAIDRLREAIELQPSNESAHFSLGNALIRKGEVEEGRKELALFRELKESFPAEAASAGLQYTELGKYAEVIEESSPPLQPPAPPERATPSAVRWTDATEVSGLLLPALDPPPPWPESIPSGEYGSSWIETRLLPYFGSGLAFRDLDGDGDPDLVSVRAGAPWVWANDAGRFSLVEAGLAVGGKWVSFTLGDADNDLDPDLYLVGPGPNALYLNDGKARFTVAEAGVAGDDVSLAASFADVDHDGDLDLYVSNYVDPATRPQGDSLRVPDDLPGAPNRLYRNNGNGTFTEIGAPSRTEGGASRSLGALFSDLDDDRDLDLLVLNDRQPVQVFSNDRVGTFTEQSLGWGVEVFARVRGAASGDFDRDGRFDLFFTAEGATLNTLLRAPSAASPYRPDLLSPGLLAAGVPGGRFGVQFLDGDNDADLDLAVVMNQAEAMVAVYENLPEGYRRAAALAAPGPDSGRGRALAVADVDGDGDLDIAVGTDRGRLFLFRNEGGNRQSWVSVRTQGLRSNRDGLGTKVEVKAGDARLRREVRSSSGYLSQQDYPLHFGLGEAPSADYVRLLWPGGVKQIEMDVPSGRSVTIEELNRKGTSCPILYTWDGSAVRFVTDFLGGSALGYLLTPGVYNFPDTDEYVKFEDVTPQPRDGFYDVRWVNQLEEVLMYDRAALVAVDHPEQVEVFPNERLMPGPPYPGPRLYAVQALRPPISIRDGRGRDVTELLRLKDGRYPSDFELLPFKGYAEPHSLTLDLGSLGAADHTVLLLYGWVDYADSSSNLAAAQAGVRLVPPFLEVEAAPGRFETALPQMGFPAGLPKTMLVDLAGMVGGERRRIRITTSMRIYWDQIRVATVSLEAPLRVTELEPARAELRFHGYPTAVETDPRKPPVYDYSRSSPTESWDQHEGDYTRYGDVRELVLAVDDRYVISRHGDELALGFAASRLPGLGAGQSRTLLLFADGFGKDMDLNSARPDTIEPLPFHAMSAYPYPETERFPDSEAHRLYRAAYNTRRQGRATEPAGAGPARDR